MQIPADIGQVGGCHDASDLDIFTYGDAATEGHEACYCASYYDAFTRRDISAVD
jgi:hypothetical protein